MGGFLDMETPGSGQFVQREAFAAREGYAAQWCAWQHPAEGGCPGGDHEGEVEICVALGNGSHSFVARGLGYRLPPRTLWIDDGSRHYVQYGDPDCGEAFLQLIVPASGPEGACRDVLGLPLSAALRRARTKGMLFLTHDVDDLVAARVLRWLDSEFVRHPELGRLKTDLAVRALCLIAAFGWVRDHDPKPLWRFPPGAWRARNVLDRLELSVQVQAEVDEHLSESLTLERLARRVALSPAHMCVVVKQSFGVTPGEYVNRARLEAGRALLETSARPVTEIASRVGFDQPSYFTQRFRSAFGRSPSDFRRRPQGDKTDQRAQTANTKSSGTSS